jgi:inosine-uridine nucleoside N-ribohydrolase
LAGSLISKKDPSLVADNKPEYNFEQDPTAALQVLESSYTRDKVFLVTQETCLNTVHKSNADSLEAFASQYKKESLLARTLLWFDDSLVYDPVTGFCYTNNSSCQAQDVHVKVTNLHGWCRRPTTQIHAVGYKLQLM